MVNGINNRGQGLIEFLIVVTLLGMILSWLATTGNFLLSHRLATHWLQELAVCHQVENPTKNCETEFQKRMKGALPWYNFKIQNGSSTLQGTFRSQQVWAKDFQIKIQISYPLRRGSVALPF